MSKITLNLHTSGALHFKIARRIKKFELASYLVPRKMSTGGALHAKFLSSLTLKSWRNSRTWLPLSKERTSLKVNFTESISRVDHYEIQWCLDLVDSDLVDCRDLVDYFCCLYSNENGQMIP